MIKVLIPADVDFCIYENQLKVLYEKCQEQIDDSNSFDFIKNNTLFYMFLNDHKLLGGIYYYKKFDKLFVNCFAYRHQHLINLKCLKMSLNWFKCDIYAFSENKMSAYCLLKVGFKRLRGSIFVYNRKEYLCHLNTL